MNKVNGDGQVSKRQLQRDLKEMFVHYRRQTILCQILAVALYRQDPNHGFFTVKTGVLTREQISETEKLALTGYLEEVTEKLKDLMGKNDKPEH